MKKLMHTIAFVLCVAALCLVDIGNAHAALQRTRSGYKVTWTRVVCPNPCQHWLRLEPTYYQAKQLARLLVDDGWRVRIVKL